MNQLKAAGVDAVGIHVESFDQDTLRRIAPAKAAIGLARYEKAWKRAVDLFGTNQVSSFLIAGIGETPASIVSGSEILADSGVYPFVVPLRPIPGSQLENRLPPDPDTMKRIYSAVADILKKKGISSKACTAGCVRCGACSALPAYEEAADSLICHTARNDREIAEALAIRNEVFVQEQGIFKETDIDENDARSMHLVAKMDGDIIGTVRVFPVSGNGHWIGGRLAVRKANRVEHIGAALVREAMKRVKKRGCTKFTAYIQEKNIRFFKRLGWDPVGTVEPFHNRPHQLMAADLDQVPHDF